MRTSAPASRSLSFIGVAKRSLLFESPEIEAAHALRIEGFRYLDRALQNFVLLLPVEKPALKLLSSLNFDFGAPGQSTLNSGLAMSVTFSWLFLENAASSLRFPSRPG